MENQEKNIIYRGYRPQDSLNIHESFSNKSPYPFTFPPKSMYPLLEIIRECIAPK